MAQYYVDKAAGNDSNTGLTAALAKKTIQPTLSLLQAGDTLNILAGDYNETLSSTTGLNAGSSFGSPITVKAYNGAAVTVRNVVWYHTNAEYWIFQDLKIDGQYTETVCAYVAGLSHIKFIGCEITHSKQFGSFNTRTDDVYFTECNIHHNGQTPGNDHGMFVAGTTTFIDGCTVHDNMGYGIHLYEANAGTAGFSTDLSQVTRNKVYSNGKSATVYSAGILLSAGNTLLCANNILWNNKNAGIEVGYSLVTNAKVYNNTLYNNGGYGIDIRSDATTVLITNNIVYSNSGGTINDEGASGVVLTTNLTTDPTFVSVSGLDFHIQTTSTAKDAGTTLGDVTVDYDGGTRPFNAIYDIGAFEFGATASDVPAPPADTSGTFTGPGAVINPDGSITAATNTVPFGGFFFNTLDEFSLPTVLAVQKSTDTLPNDSLFDEDWINVVRDFGVLGDGTDETAKIQAALDFAASSGTKSKVLIPGGITVLVSPQFIDNCIFGYWGHLWIALFIDSNVTLRIDGTIKMAKPTAAQSSIDYAAVIANRNSFRVVSGSGNTTNYNNVVPTGFTGDLQGFLNSGAHNNNVSSTTVQLTNSPDLSQVVAGTYIPFPNNLYSSGPLRLGCVGGSGRQLSEIVSVDNTAKTITVTDAFPAISAASPRRWYVENNYVDENITIEGNGTIDCDYDDTSADWSIVFAFRMARCRRLTIKGIRILDAAQQAIEITLAEYVKIQDVDIELSDETTGFLGAEGDIALDCCSYVLVEGCNFIVPPTEILLFTATGGNVPGTNRAGTIGVFAWATRNLIVKNCTFVNNMNGVAFNGTVGLVQLQGYGMNALEGNGTIWGFLDERDDNRIIWNMAQSLGDGSTAADTFIEVDWNLLVDGNIVTNNAGGMTFLGETFFGMPGKGIKVVNNFICNNEGYGIGLGTCYNILIANNSIKQNGWVNGSFYLK